MMGEYAAFQSELIGEGWQETHHNRRARGLPAIGGKRFGYHWIRNQGETERYEINPEQAGVLAWMYAAYNSGSGGPGIARELNRRGITNAREKPWHAKTVRDVLDSGFGAGLLRRVPVDADGVKITGPFQQIVWDQGAHPAIITSDEWEKYKRTRVQRGQQHPRRVAARYTLSGLVQCGDCTAAMTRRDRTGNRERPYVQLICRRSTDSGGVCMVTVSEHRAIDAVKQWLTELADDIGDAAESARRSEHLQLTTRATAEEAQRELDRIDKQLATLRRHLIAERMTEAEYDQTRAELLAEQQTAVERLALAKQQAATEETEPARVVALGLLAEWDTLPVTRRRDLLSRLIRKVQVTPPERRYGLAGISIIPAWAPA
ncbi:Recombinase zinc beta ribbon domain-containing protein [Prauserella halophila]|nr:Recombinase zinc beta ribbon domain-containing protein [Prauserella halophila]